MLRHNIAEDGSIRTRFIDPGIAFASTVSTFDYALKERYTSDMVENLTLSERPYLAKVAKSEDLSGDTLVVPITHVNPQGVAGSGQSTASANETNIVGKKFNATPGEYFASVTIGRKVLKLSRGNAGAFLSNQLAETDGLYEQAADSIATYLAGNGGGALGARASAATNVITLVNPSDTANFEEGMTVVASANDGSDSAHALRTGSTTVTAVDRIAGTVTLASAAAITSFADADSLFRQGDFFGNTGVVVVKGVGAYIWPNSSPPSLYGMTRTSDVQRLAGCRVAAADLSGRNIEERLKLLGSYMAGRFKAKGPWDLYMHPEDWQTLETSVESRGIRPLEDDSTKFGFSKLRMVLGGQTVDIFPDRFFPRRTGFMLRMKNWKLYSAGKFIETVNDDGLTMLRKVGANDFELRLAGIMVHMCNAPGYSGRVDLP
jgi:hypothetical protein